MSAARIDSDGGVTILDGRAEPDEIITEGDVQDPAKLARRLAEVSKSIADLRRAFVPSVRDYEDIPVSTAGAVVQLEHRFGGRVRWYLVGWQSAGTAAPILKEETSLTTNDTLALMSYVAGTACIRVESAG